MSNFRLLVKQMQTQTQDQVSRALREIYTFFETPPTRFMRKEEAIVFVLWYVKQQDSYGTELMDYVEEKLSEWELSDTILHLALKFLEQCGLVERYQKGVEGRGRPRNMIKIPADLSPEDRQHVDNLASLWATRCHKGA